MVHLTTIYPHFLPNLEIPRNMWNTKFDSQRVLRDQIKCYRVAIPINPRTSSNISNNWDYINSRTDTKNHLWIKEIINYEGEIKRDEMDSYGGGGGAKEDRLVGGGVRRSPSPSSVPSRRSCSFALLVHSPIGRSISGNRQIIWIHLSFISNISPFIYSLLIIIFLLIMNKWIWNISPYLFLV